MRIGLIADIHEHVDDLRAVIAELDQQGVDRLLHLGDIASHGVALNETCAVLSEYGIDGVWGNHELGLVNLDGDEAAVTATTYTVTTLAYLARLKPIITLRDGADPVLKHGVLLCHAGPWIDPRDPLAMWTSPYQHLSEPDRIKDAVAQAHVGMAFMGHHHCWRAFIDGVDTGWRGDAPLDMQPDRKMLVVVDPVFNRSAGILDTETAILTPLVVR